MEKQNNIQTDQTRKQKKIPSSSCNLLDDPPVADTSTFDPTLVGKPSSTPLSVLSGNNFPSKKIHIEKKKTTSKKNTYVHKKR
jgi:hypothetical protein